MILSAIFDFFVWQVRHHDYYLLWIQPSAFSLAEGRFFA